MPEKNLRRRALVSGGRKGKAPHQSQSPSKRATPPWRPGIGKKPSKPSQILERCSSEPLLLGSDDGGDDQDLVESRRSLLSEGEGGLLPLTYMDVSVSSPSLLPPLSPQNLDELKGYKKDAKVVVNVTVEGSPGPVRGMVKLGSSVEDIIKLVVDKYVEEGRTPKLVKDAACSYELHQSHFSLQSLDKSELIGDVGRRSFYLRRSSSNRSYCSGASLETITTTRNNSSPPVVAGNLGKLIRRAQRLWQVLFCWQ